MKHGETCVGAGEMSQQLRALPEESSSNPSTHMKTPNSLSLQFQGIHDLLLASMGVECMWCAQIPHAHEIKINKP